MPTVGHSTQSKSATPAVLLQQVPVFHFPNREHPFIGYAIMTIWDVRDWLVFWFAFNGLVGMVCIQIAYNRGWRWRVITA